LEIVSNIFTLDINSKSTTYLISIYIKLLQQLNKQKEKSKYVISYIELKEVIKEIDEKELIEQKRIIESTEYLKGRMFQHMYRVLKNNIDSVDDMYDILVFMKLLDKKLSGSFLSKILSIHKES